MLAPIMSVMA